MVPTATRLGGYSIELDGEQGGLTQTPLDMIAVHPAGSRPFHWDKSGHYSKATVPSVPAFGLTSGLLLSVYPNCRVILLLWPRAYKSRGQTSSNR